MLRPLDQALIDLEKTYREIFKQPLYEHEQYTKRQLIYNYAEIGSQFIYDLITTKKQLTNENQFDLAQVIKQWNDKTVTVEQMLQPKQKNKQNNQKPLPNLPQDEDKAFLKQIEVVKKDKLITKSRNQRNLNYRKQLEILFKSRNINMLNVETMRTHFSDLKPYNNFHSKNKTKKYQDNYQDKYQDRYQDKYEQKYQDKYEQRYQDKYEQKYQDKYEHKYQEKYQQRYSEKNRYSQRSKYEHSSKHSDDEQNYQQNYTIANVKKQSFVYRTPSQSYKESERNEKKQYGIKRQESTRYQEYEKDSSLSPTGYKSQYQFRPPSYFPPPPDSFKPVSQFVTTPEYSRPPQEQIYKNYPQQETNPSHNQFYAQNFPKPYQSQMSQSSNVSQTPYGNNYRGSYGSKTQLKEPYRPQ